MASEYSIATIPAINRLGGAVPTYQQQTFLGASISSFTANGGFGDSSSTLGVELVVDEYNKGDGTGVGQGQDVYHNGVKDNFTPPPVGSPVFFAFGNSRASVQDAYTYAYNQYYGTAMSAPSGSNHFTFGGILQSFTQNKSSATYSMYSAQIVDPREILSNVQLVLNNYAGSTFGCDNIFNIYGFLEFNSTSMKSNFESANAHPVTTMGTGSDMWYSTGAKLSIPESIKFYNSALTGQMFPMTGTGFARRVPQGIPYYRIAQALNAFANLNYTMPSDYVSAGFGGFVNFRGLKYAIDLSSLPQLPPFYCLDYDQISVLDLCLEICEVSQRDLYVTLLPIINHPACGALYSRNNANTSDLVAGIIKVDAIDRSQPPIFGSIKNFIDQVKARGIPVENQDLGFELSNIVTDKFIAGGQEVDMYFFSTNSDRNVNSTNAVQKWTLEGMLKQQVLPYYGLLGNKAVTIPKGFGPYQQILLDATGLDANGVGNYYVATEIELRSALVSFERWSEFLMMYNDLYMESAEENDIREIFTAVTTPADPKLPPIAISQNYVVTVPRSVWTSDNNTFDSNGLPRSACNPPYGWPLYYKRATQIGLPQAGLAGITAINTRILTQLTQLKNATGESFKALVNSIWSDLNSGGQSSYPSESEKQFYEVVRNAIITGGKSIALIERAMNNVAPIVAYSNTISKQNKQNALRVYNFVKNIAEECLGKKFLVKIPRSVNPNFSDTITKDNSAVGATIYDSGPFGFPQRNIKNQRVLSGAKSNKMIQNFLSNKTQGLGELIVNYSPLTDNFEFNYQPDNQGGYPSYYSTFGAKAVSQGLVPMDITNFKNENNRLSAYVRFDNSHQLSFDNFSSDSFTQQAIVNGYFIPDISYSLDNAVSTANNTFEPLNQYNTVPSVAFVKCEVDDRLYMPPAMVNVSIDVYGRHVNHYDAVEKPRTIVDKKGVVRQSYSYSRRMYFPDASGATSKANVTIFNIVTVTTTTTTTAPPNVFPPPTVSTTAKPPQPLFTNPLPNNFSVDPNHVYALITLPNKVIPTVSTRYRDAMSFQVNAANFRHFLALDVVQGVTGFEKPPSFTFNDSANMLSNISHQSLAGIDNVDKAVQKSYEGLTFTFANRIRFSSPSPVYPDLVVLPLQSKERCYGPWISSFNSIGGKIEFVKDENLTPWNYNGYEGMNQVGKLQAEFGYSASLISERGGFTVPDIPAGVPLGRALVAGGPLITSVSVEVSQNGIKSTYKMDSYTPSFGKLQKQRQDAIGNILRNKQKQTDEKNMLIRKSLGKGQKNINYTKLYQQLQRSNLQIDYSDYYAGTYTPSNSISISATPLTSYGISTDQSSAMPTTANTENTERFSQTRLDGAFTSQNDTEHSAELLSSTEKGFSESAYNTASSDVTDMYMPASLEPYHPNMSFMPFISNKSSVKLYEEIDNNDSDTFTSWERD